VSGQGAERFDEALAVLVPAGDEKIAFGEITADAARAQSRSLKEIGNFGPLVRVAKVALGWAQLAALLDQSGAERVSDLEPKAILDFAERLWLIPPEGGLI